MRAIEQSIERSIELPTCAPRFHHIAIETNDLDNCVAWYQDFFGGHVSWSLSTFSALTLSRLPGILRLIEVVIGDVRLHLFERNGDGVAQTFACAVQFQHVCVAVNSHVDLMKWRDRWLDLFTLGRYKFAREDEPTGIVVDADGIESFYALDVNGLEYEFTYEPSGVR